MKPIVAVMVDKEGRSRIIGVAEKAVSLAKKLSPILGKPAETIRKHLSSLSPLDVSHGGRKWIRYDNHYATVIVLYA